MADLKREYAMLNCFILMNCHNVFYNAIIAFILHWILNSLLFFLLIPGLPQTKLGNFLETKVNEYLKRQSHPETGDVTVRVVHVSDKVVEVKPGMKSR